MDFKILLVTGATGYLGSNLINFLHDQRYLHTFDLLVFVDRRLKTKNINARLLKKNNVLFVESDLNQIARNSEGKEGLRHINKEIKNYLFEHARGRTYSYTFIHTAKLEQNNLFINWVADTYGRSHKFIFYSSVAVYGDSKDSKDYKNVGDKLSPVSAYGQAKIASESRIQNTLNNYYILRIANPYGKETTFAGLKPYYELKIKQLARLKSITNMLVPINADEAYTTFRDFVYIDDLNKAILHILQNPHTERILNIATGKSTSVEDFFKIVVELYVKQHKLDISTDKLCEKVTFEYEGLKQIDIKCSAVKPSLDLESL